MPWQFTIFTLVTWYHGHPNASWEYHLWPGNICKFNTAVGVVVSRLYFTFINSIGSRMQPFACFFCDRSVWLEGSGFLDTFFLGGEKPVCFMCHSDLLRTLRLYFLFSSRSLKRTPYTWTLSRRRVSLWDGFLQCPGKCMEMLYIVVTCAAFQIQCLFHKSIFFAIRLQ